jgi:hypothetical protein
MAKSFIEDDDIAADGDAPRERTIDIDARGELERRMSEVAHMAAEAAVNRMPIQPNQGRIHFNGSTKIVLWMLGIFGGVMTVLLTLVLQAVYTTNGSVNQLQGQQSSNHDQIVEMHQEMSAFQAEMMALAQRQSNVRQ